MDGGDGYYSSNNMAAGGGDGYYSSNNMDGYYSSNNMAAGGGDGYYSSNNMAAGGDGYYSSPYRQSSSSLSIHLCFFFTVLFLFMGFMWYINHVYESMFENIFDQMKLVFILTPLVLLLAIYLLCSDDRQRFPFLMPLPERGSLHRAGGTPWGVGLLLVFLLFMISFQSDLHDSWFPLLRKRRR